MPSEIPQQYSKKLNLLFTQINTQNNDHITKEQLRQWLQLCMNDQDIAQNSSVKELASQVEDGFQFWVDAYLREVCNLEPQNIQNLQFKQQQTIEFFAWLLDTQTSGQEEQINDGQAQQQSKEINFEEEQAGPLEPDNIQKNVSKVSHSKSPVQNTSHLSENPQPKNKISPKHLFTQQQPNEFTQALTHSQPIHQVKSPKNIEDNSQLPEDDDRYKQYLETIFEHYCKISFGLTKDNTFESMQKNVSIITMNKFMIFANDFELNVLLAATLPKQNNQKPSKIQIRNLLMDVFKKHSAFHKEMNFQQFLTALEKIAQTSFTKMKIAQNSPQSQGEKTQSHFSFQMTKMIKYLQISSFKEFRQKMTKFNINFSLKFNKGLQEKKIPINYKFKFESEQNIKKLSEHNDKLQNKPVLPLQKRNIVLRQGEQNVNRQKQSMDLGKPPLQSKMSTPNMMPMASNNLVPKDKKSMHNAKNASSHQKLGNININSNRNIIPFSNPQKVVKHSLEKVRSPAPAYEGVLEGYANIHLAKKGLLAVDAKSSQGGVKKKGEFQLNNVIEEARKQAQDPRIYYDYLDSRSGRALSNISTSKPLSHYSRDPASNQSHRQSRNDQQLQLNLLDPNPKKMHKNLSQNPSMVKNSRVVSLHNELEGLIDFNQSDQDEYLHQHLKKEKENDTEITVRVQKKISSFNFKP